MYLLKFCVCCCFCFLFAVIVVVAVNLFPITIPFFGRGGGFELMRVYICKCLSFKHEAPS